MSLKLFLLNYLFSLKQMVTHTHVGVFGFCFMKFEIENYLIPQISIEIHLSLQYTDQMFQIPIYFLNYRYNFTCVGSSYPCWQFLSKCSGINITVSLPAPFLGSCLCFTMDMSQDYPSSMQLCIYSLWRKQGLIFAVAFLPIRNKKFVFFKGVLPGNKLLLETSYCSLRVQQEVTNR